MKHPSKETLENYAARQLSEDEMTFVILHLEDCADCFAAVQKLVPTAETQSVLLFAETEKFHLDYDEHLRPFVDNEANSATCEIVESHSQACANCAFQLRELREFSESLRLREIEKTLQNSPTFLSKMSGWFRQLSQNLAFQIALPLLLVIFGLAAIVYFSGDSTQNNSQKVSLPNSKIEENQAVEAISPELNQNSLIAKIVNQNVKSENQSNENTSILPNSANKTTKDNSAKTFDEVSAELNNLSADLREKIETVLQSKKLAFPSFLPALQEKINLRGNETQQKIELYPNGEAVRETSPTLSWKEFAAKNELYVVEIFDEANNLVEASESLKTLNWKPKTILKRGQLYKWEVRLERANDAQNSETFAGTFRVLDQKTVDDLAKISAKSSFIRGIAFTFAGLFTSAEKEFRQTIKENKNAQPAKSFLQQLSKQRK